MTINIDDYRLRKEIPDVLWQLWSTVFERHVISRVMHRKLPRDILIVLSPLSWHVRFLVGFCIWSVWWTLNCKIKTHLSLIISKVCWSFCRWMSQTVVNCINWFCLIGLTTDQYFQNFFLSIWMCALYVWFDRFYGISPDYWLFNAKSCLYKYKILFLFFLLFVQWEKK